MSSFLIWAGEGASRRDRKEHPEIKEKYQTDCVSECTGAMRRVGVHRPNTAEKSVRRGVGGLLGLATRELLTPACAVSARAEPDCFWGRMNGW